MPEESDLPIWWSLDQTLIWIATSDAKLASMPELRVIDFELAMDDAWAVSATSSPTERFISIEGSSTGLDLSPARKALLRKLQTGELLIHVGGELVSRLWFNGAEFDFSGGDQPKVRLSRWRKNLARRSEAIPPDHLHDVEIEVASVMALFPARGIASPTISEPAPRVLAAFSEDTSPQFVPAASEENLTGDETNEPEIKGKTLSALQGFSAVFPKGVPPGLDRITRDTKVRDWLRIHQAGVTVGDRYMSDAYMLHKNGRRAD